MHETMYVSAAISPLERRAHQFRLYIPANVLTALRKPSALSFELSGDRLTLIGSEHGRIVSPHGKGAKVRMGLLKSSAAHKVERCPVHVEGDTVTVTLPEAMAQELARAWGGA